jgi:hydrogenase maturation factor
VDVSLVDAVRTHDLVLAHAGVAIRKLPAHEILS